MDEFIDIEEKLLEILVIKRVDQKSKNASPTEFIKQLRIQYSVEVNDARQVFIRQSGGNLFGKAESLTLQKDSIHVVQGIDTLGTMLDSVPYVEVEWKDGFFLEPLEPIQNLKFLIE